MKGNSCNKAVGIGIASNILIVDMDRNILDQLDRILSSEQVVVHRATSGREAIKVCRASIVELAIIDMRLPDMHGYELVLELKEIQPSIRVIMASEDYSPEAEANARRSGIIYYAQKRFCIDLLRMVVMKGISHLSSHTA